MDNYIIIFNKKDVIKKFNSNKQFENWIFNKIKSNKIIKIRNALYSYVDISTSQVYANKYQIASKISDSSFLCYHSALEYYGLANQVFNDIVVGSLTRFNSFSFDDVQYDCKLMKDTSFVNYLESTFIKITCLEKTIIDCVDDINLAGGLQELVYALQQVKYLDESLLVNILEHINKTVLYQKVGFLFQYYLKDINISDDFFMKCKVNIKEKVNYLDKSFNQEIILNKEWNLIVPKYMERLISGGNINVLF